MVNLDVTTPTTYSRSQLAIRIAIWVLLGWFGITLGWLACALFVALPLIAAGAIHSSTDYPEEHGGELWDVIAFLLRFEAYLLCTVDTFASTSDVDIELEMHGHPTVRSALMRCVTALPVGLIVLIASAFAWIVGAFGFLTILVARHVPEPLLGIQRATLRLQARFLAYHASLVDDYPSLTFDTHAHRPMHRAA
ncbi:MAG: DUF4389 domain-containing protein [Kofleriaceae bacterium]